MEGIVHRPFSETMAQTLRYNLMVTQTKRIELYYKSHML